MNKKLKKEKKIHFFNKKHQKTMKKHQKVLKSRIYHKK